MRRVNPHTADPASTTFTYFYLSAHNADRSVLCVADGAQSSTAPAARVSFVPVAVVVAGAKNRTR